MSLNKLVITQDFDLLTNRFVDEWDASVPAFFELQPDFEAPLDTAWVRFTIRPGAPVTRHGGRTHGFTKRVGRIYLQIFVPANGGDALAIELVDRFSTIFRYWYADNLVCDAETVYAPKEDENGMVQYMVSIPYSSTRANVSNP